MLFAFEDFELDTQRLELRRAGATCHLEPQVFDLLAYLLEHHDRLVTKEELLEAIWPDRFVSDSALSSRIKAARQAIGDSGSAQRLIRTHHGRGFRFVGALRRMDAEAASSVLVPASTPAITDLSVERMQTIVGREAELAVLQGRWHHARDGQRQVVFLTAEAGYGKTALVDTFSGEILARRGGIVARGQCMQQMAGGGEPYQPVIEIIESLARSMDGERFIELMEHFAPSWLAEMPWLIASERRATILERLATRAVGITRERMLGDVVRVLESFAVDQPLVLIIEDLHWSDPSTLDVIRRLAQRAERAQMMVIGTYRPTDVRELQHPVQALQHELRIHGKCILVGLGPLDADDVARHMHARSGRVPPIGLADALHAKTGGVPLFVEIVLGHWLASRGDLRSDDVIESFVGAIPETLAELILHALDGLSELDRMLLEAAAVCGERFDVARVSAAGDVTDEEAEQRLDALARVGRFVRSAGSILWPDGTWTEQLEFAHVLYQNVLYDRIPAVRRARLHGAIARRLATGFASRPADVAAQIAGHLLRSGRAGEAIPHLAAAAEQALRRNAHIEAAEYLDEAMLHLHSIGNEEACRTAEIELRMTRVPTLIALDGWASTAAEQDLERVIELCRDDADEAILSRARYHLAVIYEFRGEFARAQELVEHRLRVLSPDDLRANLESRELLACSRYHQGAFDEAMEYARQGLALYDPADHLAVTASVGENPGVSCHNWSALAMWFTGRADAAVEESERAIALAKQATHSFSLASALAMAAVLRQYRREPIKAQILAEEAERLARAHGFRYFEAVATMLRGWAWSVRGGGREAIHVIEDGLAILDETGAMMDRPYFQSLLAEACVELGQWKTALNVIDEAIGFVAGSRSYCYEAELHRLRGDILAKIGRADEAEAAYRTAIDVARRQDARLPELRAAQRLFDRWRVQGRTLDAITILRATTGRFDDMAAELEVADARRVLAAVMVE